MNPPEPGTAAQPLILSDLQRWTPRRWWQAIVSVLAAHVVLVWIFGPAQNAPLPARPPKATLHFAADAQAQLELDASALIQDAALLPMPGLHGFSQEGWLRYQPLPHQWTDWTDGRRWLPLDPQSLGTDFSHQAGREAFPPMPIAEKPEPPPTGHPLSAAPLDLPKQSTLVVMGPLARAARAVTRPPDLPSWPHADVLSDTVIQTLVDHEGYVFSATILVPCGFPQADGWALHQARVMRFEPDPNPARGPAGSESNRFTAGRLVFHWRTTPAPPPGSLLPKTL